MNFGKAIELLREGKKLQREGWNGKKQYIEIAQNISYKNTQGEIVNAEHDAIGNKAIAFTLFIFVTIIDVMIKQFKRK